MEKKNSFHPVIGRIFRAFVCAFIYICFRPSVRYRDKEKIKSLKDKPVIFIFNHTSYYDGILASVITRKFRPYTVVAKDWYDKKGINFFIRLNRSIPIDRKNPDAEWFLTAEKMIKLGHSVCIFPQGSISRGGETKPYHPGFAMLAMSTGAPVVPVAIGEKYRIIFGKRQKILFGEPVYCAVPENTRRSTAARQISGQMQAQTEKLLCEIKNIEYKGDNSHDQTGNSGENQIDARREPSYTARGTRL